MLTGGDGGEIGDHRLSRFLADISLRWELESINLDREHVKLTITGEISQSQSRLALDLQTRAVHEHHQACNELGLALSQFLAVRTWRRQSDKKS